MWRKNCNVKKEVRRVCMNNPGKKCTKYRGDGEKGMDFKCV